LENRRSKNNKISGGMWKAVETKTGKFGVAETEGRRGNRRSQKEMERKRGKTKERK